MSTADVLLSFLTSLLASVVGVTIVLIVERQRRARLTLAIGSIDELPADDALGRPQTKWLHVDIINETIPKWIGWAYDRLPASQCRAWITFHYLDGHRVFPREMTARWVETPQPQVLTITTNKGQGRVLHGEQHAVDIPPGGQSAVDVVSRRATDETCHGWNNESYLHDWRHPAWAIPNGRCIVRVRVRTAGREFKSAFLLANDTGYAGLRLAPLERERLASLESVLAMELAGK